MGRGVVAAQVPRLGRKMYLLDFIWVGLVRRVVDIVRYGTNLPLLHDLRDIIY